MVSQYMLVTKTGSHSLIDLTELVNGGRPNERWKELFGRQSMGSQQSEKFSHNI
jgi:hypothetical protein